MKNKSRFFIGLWAVCLGASVLSSCLDDDDNWPGEGYVNAIVTTKVSGGGGCYLQLDDHTTLYPVNINKALYDGKEVRALTTFTYAEGVTEDYNHNVYVTWIDSIRTKQPVPTLGTTEADDEAYGTDHIELVRDWVVVEDGYLTVRFRTLAGGTGRTHYINLVTGTDPDDPYTVELRHDARGDVFGQLTDGLVAFRLNDLPDTGGKTVTLTLKWSGYEVDKSLQLEYCTRGTSQGGAKALDINGLKLNAM